MAQESTTEGEGRDDGVDSLSLGDALSIIGEETRARIVIELGEAIGGVEGRDGARSSTGDADEIPTGPLSYSELMDRVGVEDSGRFNYHLDKLVDTFVRKVDGGYLLRPPGHFLYRAVVAGTLTDRERFDPFPVADCPYCGATLTADYPGDHFLYVRCRSCEAFLHMLHLPNRGVEGRSRDELVDAAVRKNRHETGLLRQGICHACSAPVARELRTDNPGVCHCDYDAYAVYRCTACSVVGVGHPAHAALTTPPVVGFLAAHDRDARSLPPWSPLVAEAEAGSRIVDSDPPLVAVPFELDGERLELVLNDDLRVVESTRFPA